MSLMSGLYVGVTGLQTGQNALNTTAHNLSNIETQGYVRQQTYLADKVYNNVGMASVSDMQTGLGVNYSQVRQVRDYFLDQSYRREAGRSAFYEIDYETTSEIETLLGEFDGVAFQESVGNLWTSIQELQKDPSSEVTKGSLVNTAAQFVERAQAVYQGLSDYQDNLNSRVKEYVDKINNLANDIYSLNIEIAKEENRQQEANDLRDRRNQALDKISTLASITYSTNVDGGIEIQLEGATLIARDRVFEMGTVIDEGTGFYIPVWPNNENAEVFQKNQTIATSYNTDIGELKSIILARGDRRANYTDMAEDTYNDGLYYNPETGARDLAVIPTSASIVMNIQAELDQMVHSMVTEMNNILTGEKAAIDAYYASDPKDPSLLPSYEPDEELPNELFVRLGTSRYQDDGTGKMVYVLEADNPTHADVDSLYSISNVKINPVLQKTTSLLGGGFVTDDKKVDQNKADQLTNAFTKTFSALNPNLTQTYNYQDYYAAMVGQVATTGSVYSSIVSAQQVAVGQLEDSRQAVIGVSSNEELTNMIKYQNAYNAASRYITACNDMLENLLANLG